MTVIDANVLLYAYNADAPQQPVAAAYIENLLDSGEPVAIPWVTAWAFVRIATNARIWKHPLPVKRAFEIVGELMALPGVIALQPGQRHLQLLERVATRSGAGGPLLTDAILAALALENGAVVASADRDFARFTEVRWVNPLSK